ncbi:MAG: ferric reductase-like transmembrane domain-containing protein [Mycobacterium sp.]|nr:ferric reductase-like transmembrane domain-containing protein [Mycobacterium sp.]
MDLPLSSEALWALGRGNGIVALAFMTLSVVLGIAGRSARPLFALPRFGIADIHRFVALSAAILVALHIGLLFLDPYAKLRLIDLAVPFIGAYRPVWQGLGTVAVELILVVLVSSLLRQRIGLRAFRAVHWMTYLLWPIALAHSLGNGTDTNRVWFLTFAGTCTVMVAAALIWRLRADFDEYSPA